jgi:mRNA interferase RelE/StbE
VKVRISNDAKKDLRNLDEATRGRILKALNSMQEHPDNADLKKLKGFSDIWRLRFGNYRVILEVDQEEGVAYATRIKHRREAYR